MCQIAEVQQIDLVPSPLSTRHFYLIFSSFPCALSFSLLGQSTSRLTRSPPRSKFNKLSGFAFVQPPPTRILNGSRRWDELVRVCCSAHGGRRRGFTKAVARLPQMVLQKAGAAEETKDEDFRLVVAAFTRTAGATERLQDDLGKYRDAVGGMLAHQLGVLAAFRDVLDGGGGRSKVLLRVLDKLEDAKTTALGELDGLSRRLAVLDELAAAAKAIGAKVTKRNHKLLDYDRHRHSLKKLEGDKNRSVSDERKMSKLEQSLADAEAEYNKYNGQLKEDIPVFLRLNGKLLVPVMEALIIFQQRMWRAQKEALSEIYTLGDTDHAAILRAYEEDIARALVLMSDIPMLQSVGRIKRLGGGKDDGGDDDGKDGKNNKSSNGGDVLSMLSPKEVPTRPVYSKGKEKEREREKEKEKEKEEIVLTMRSNSEEKMTLAMPTNNTECTTSTMHAGRKERMTSTRYTADKEKMTLAMHTDNTESTTSTMHAKVYTAGRSEDRFYDAQEAKWGDLPGGSRATHTTSTRAAPAGTIAGSQGRVSELAAKLGGLAIGKPGPSAAPPAPKKDMVVALYDFAGSESGDLSFRTGDRIEVIKRTPMRDDWWTGRISNGGNKDGGGSKVGLFPGNYVQDLAQ